MIIKETCPNKKCGKVQREVSFTISGKWKLIKLECGHTICKEFVLVPESQEKEGSVQPFSLTSFHEYTPRPYQYEGIDFATNHGLRVLFADDMGLGKTIQILGTLKRNEKKMFPCLFITKKAIITQTAREILEWLGREHVAQTIHSSKDTILPGFDNYIIAYDMVKRIGPEKIRESIPNLKTVVLDECQAIKNGDSDRTVAVQRLLSGIFEKKRVQKEHLCNGSEKFTDTIPTPIPYLLAASGTYIKNNASEAFPILNLLKPERFPSKIDFENEFVDTYITPMGYRKYGGIKRYALESWKETLSTFVIRRERGDVLKELPPLNRSFQYTELGETVERLYKQTMKKFLDAVDEMEHTGGWEKLEARQNVLVYITKMRHLTGISKVDPCVEYVQTFLEETDRKIAIFVHHQDVGEALYRKLDELCQSLRLEGINISPPIQYTSMMSSDLRQRAIDKFQSPQCRIGVFSTLAAGEGLNLQCCSDMILLERQWNPANEEQAESRFHRMGQEVSVNATYFLAGGTIDEYFSDLVELKRKNMLQTMRGVDGMSFSEGSLMRELAEILTKKGGKKWSLSN